MVMANIIGLMEDIIKVIGYIIKCGVLVKQYGKMVDLMKEGMLILLYRYQDDKKSGLGTFIWNDGKKYIGEWLNGK
jgi:hypothetical protein